MEIRVVDAAGVRHLGEDEAGTGDGFRWIDVPSWSAEAEELLRSLGCHEMVLEACRTRNHVPTTHAYADHVFVTTQAPLLGEGGHVHLIELDQVVGRDYLVTVHGPLNPVVDPEAALVETGSVLRRMEAGRFRPTSPHELSYAITSAVARRQRAAVTAVAERLPGLERQVMESRLVEPEELLERLFLVRHELITARTMAAQSHDVWARTAALPRLPDEAARGSLRDLADQFERVRSIADGEAHFLFGVIELYQTKVHTKMTVAMERLAVIAAVTLPIAALASIEGMNMVITTGQGMEELGVVLLIMAGLSFWLLRWARRQGWW